MEEVKVFQAIRMLNNMDYLYKALREEDAQLIALVLLHLQEEKRKDVISCFEQEKGEEIVKMMKETNKENVDKRLLILMEKNIHRKLENELLRD